MGQLADLIVSESGVFSVDLRGPRLSLPLVSQAQSYKLCSCFSQIGILDRRHVDALLAANHFVEAVTQLKGLKNRVLRGVRTLLQSVFRIGHSEASVALKNDIELGPE